MFGFTALQRWGILLVLALGALFALPNFFPEAAVKAWPSFLPHSPISLGLDLRGGSYIMLEANPADIALQRMQTLEEEVRAELHRSDNGAQIQTGDLSLVGNKLSFLLRNPGDVDRAVERMRALTRPSTGGQRDFDVAVVDGARVTVAATDAGLRVALNTAMDQAVEIVRRRIDELGTREPTIVRQGDNRIVVQVPGLQDPTALKALIGKTAKLEFKLVDVDANPADVQAGRAPPGSQVLAYSELSGARAGGGAIAVHRRVIVAGDELIDSKLSQDQNGQPAVDFRFNSGGARKFAKVTQENSGKPFAIILDNKVISAPRINEPILGGSGIISGSFTTESANQLAILLRSGKLPVALTVIEERTVGPDLGRDSIRAGAIASAVSIVAVALFMLVTYGRFGVYADLGLLAHLVLILGLMSVTGATLTLPGIAGLVLTIGAAVDANVLINERVREEQRKGRRIVDAVATGYKEATRTIWDANISNALVAVVMFFFGSGPVKGFAVVLLIGIATAVFTAVTVSRLFVANWLRGRPKELVI